MQPILVPVREVSELETAITPVGNDGDGGLIAMPETFTTQHRDAIIALAAAHRLPAVYPFRFFATGGGLLSYGANETDGYRNTASCIDRILRGEKPGDLPVQLPTKLQLVINVRTAKALGIAIPQTLLLSADEVIE